ncbi:DUF4932 domain-containing protein [bacterium]|nr:DUF4932 domain-containing protein [bacterium]
MQKRFFQAIGFLFFTQLLFPQVSGGNQYKFQVSVDPRVELVSIAFYLAGNPEYRKGRINSYLVEIESNFGSNRHPLVLEAIRLRQKRGISYDAPMSLAIHVSNDGNFQERIPFSPIPEGLDKRWTSDESRKFCLLAREFSKQTNFQVFFDGHKLFYEQAVKRLRNLLDTNAHGEWFDRFFGFTPKGKFNIILAPVNGPHSYGPRFISGDTQEFYCILGIWGSDPGGNPYFEKDTIPWIMHEFSHSYLNPLVSKFETKLASAGSILFEAAKPKMLKMAYVDWKTMIEESLVRAVVIQYVSAYDGVSSAEKLVQTEIQNGFPCMRELVDLLGEFERTREAHASLETFFPRVVDLFNAYSKNLVKKE